MDLSKLSNEDLMALRDGKLDAVSDEGLQSLRGAPKVQPVNIPEAQPAPISGAESAVLGAGNSALVGMGKPILAGVATLKDKLEGSDKGWGQLYGENSQLAGDTMQQASQQNPTAYKVASAAGAIGSPLNAAGVAGGAVIGGIEGYQEGQKAGRNPLISGALGAGVGAAANKTLGEVGKAAGNLADIYAKPLTSALQREVDTVAPTFAKAAAQLLTAQPVKSIQTGLALGGKGLLKKLQESPEKFGRFATVLQQAAQRGTLPVTTYLLNQMSPEYRQHVADIDKDEDNGR